MNILYTFDDKFAEVAGLSILSLFENNKDADEINVYAVCKSVSDANKQKLLKLQEDYGRKIILLDAPSVEKIAGTAIEIQDKRFSLAMFNAIFISSILPPDMKKILYLDCDTIIRSSIAGLWDMDQWKNIVRGVGVLRKRLPYQQIFLKRRRDIYISSGVFLINLDLWRHYDVEAKFIKFIRLMDGKLPANEESVLNSVLKGYIGAIDPTYNFFHTNFNDKMSIYEKFINAKDRKRVREIALHNNPKIVHYPKIMRKIDKAESGWDSPLICTFRSDWYKWREMSPWRGLPLDHLRMPPPQWCPLPVTTKRKAIRSSILRFTEKNCKPLHSLLNSLGICLKAFLRSTGSLFDEAVAEPARVRKYNKYRQKVTGINIKDCRISKRERKRLINNQN
ncbi:MAG: glycosyltransferase family 8 protein [Oscillospiraceae bacterium]|nr:glycosyltransferase family 8 protein [Oscillospiraceae bacterium]